MASNGIDVGNEFQFYGYLLFTLRVCSRTSRADVKQVGLNVGLSVEDDPFTR